jgi:hypothetical protein
MPIDASIPLGVKPVQIDSPFESYAKAEQIKGLRAQGQYRDLQMQELMDKRMREQGRRGILSRGLQGEELAGALEQGGYLDDATQYRESIDKRKDGAIKREKEIVSLYGELSKGVMAMPTEQSAIAAIERLEQVTGRKMDNERAQIYSLRGDPEGIRRLAAGAALEAEKLLGKFQEMDTGGQRIGGMVDPLTGGFEQTVAIDKTATPGEVMTDKRTREEGAAGRAVTMRGQNMTDARAREAAAITAATGKASDWQYDGDRGVLINKQTGETKTPTGLEGKPVKLTEGQGKAFMFGNRAAEADRIITDLTGKYSPTALAAKSGAGKVWGVGGALEMGANAMLGESEQKAEQAQRDFINAVLRQESGAVIADSEFDNAKKQYFPQPGDSAQVIKQKAANRLRAIEGFRVVSGPVADQIGGEPKARTGASGNWEPQKVETDNLPDPAQYIGAVMTDSQTGLRYKSDGKGWVRQ